MESITTYQINLNGVDNLSPEAATAVAGGLIGFGLTAGIAIAILLIIACWKIFEKAGEKGWKAIIPFYNVYILFKICGIQNWFWGFLGVTIFAGILMCVNPPVSETLDINTSGSLIDITTTKPVIDWSEHTVYLIGTIIDGVLALAVSIATSIKLAKAFGKGVGFTLGLIFLSGIFYLILGFGKAKYSKKAIKA